MIIHGHIRILACFDIDLLLAERTDGQLDNVLRLGLVDVGACMLVWLPVARTVGQLAAGTSATSQYCELCA